VIFVRSRVLDRQVGVVARQDVGHVVADLVGDGTRVRVQPQADHGRHPVPEPAARETDVVVAVVVAIEAQRRDAQPGARGHAHGQGGQPLVDVAAHLQPEGHPSVHLGRPGLHLVDPVLRRPPVPAAGHERHVGRPRDRPGRDREGNDPLVGPGAVAQVLARHRDPAAVARRAVVAASLQEAPGSAGSFLVRPDGRPHHELVQAIGLDAPAAPARHRPLRSGQNLGHGQRALASLGKSESQPARRVVDLVQALHAQRAGIPVLEGLVAEGVVATRPACDGQGRQGK